MQKWEMLDFALTQNWAQPTSPVTEGEGKLGRPAAVQSFIKACMYYFLFFFLFSFFCSGQEAKKKYDKETEKYCGVLEKHLNLSSKKKESQLQEVRVAHGLLFIIPSLDGVHTFVDACQGTRCCELCAVPLKSPG